MNESFDDQLKKALRPIDPGDDFTSVVMKRVGDEPPAPKLVEEIAYPTSPWRSFPLGRPLCLTTGFAASLVLVVGIVQHEQHEREAGMRARQQLLDALYVTSEKLNIAYRVVRDQSEISIEAEAPSEERQDGDADNGA